MRARRHRSRDRPLARVVASASARRRADAATRRQARSETPACHQLEGVVPSTTPSASAGNLNPDLDRLPRHALFATAYLLEETYELLGQRFAKHPSVKLG